MSLADDVCAIGRVARSIHIVDRMSAPARWQMPTPSDIDALRRWMPLLVKLAELSETDLRQLVAHHEAQTMNALIGAYSESRSSSERNLIRESQHTHRVAAEAFKMLGGGDEPG